MLGFGKKRKPEQNDSSANQTVEVVAEEVVENEIIKDIEQNDDELNETAIHYTRRYPKFKGIWVNPFQRMEPKEKVLRLCLVLGIFPFTFIGCIIGSIYGIFIRKKRSRIHDKLHRANILACILYLFISAIVVALAFASSNNKNPKLKQMPTFLMSNGNQFTITSTNENFKHTLLIIEHGKVLLPEILPDAKKYEFNVIHAKLTKSEDELMKKELMWTELVKSLKLDPQNVVLVTTVGMGDVNDIKYGKYDQWLGLLLVGETSERDDPKFMVQFLNKKIMCNGNETWIFSTIRPNDTPNYFISREKAFEVLKNHITKIKDETPVMAENVSAAVDQNVLENFVESINLLRYENSDIKTNIEQNLCAMSMNNIIPSSKFMVNNPVY